jgi:hypothetical protein
MTKEIKNLILIYVLPIIAMSLGLGAVHPLFGQVILFMIGGVSLIVIGMAFLIDWMDSRG